MTTHRSHETVRFTIVVPRALVEWLRQRFPSRPLAEGIAEIVVDAARAGGADLTPEGSLSTSSAEFLKWWRRQYLTYKDDAVILTRDAYDKYLEWCRENRLRTMGVVGFGRALAQACAITGHIRWRGTKGERGWARGLKMEFVAREDMPPAVQRRMRALELVASGNAEDEEQGLAQAEFEEHETKQQTTKVDDKV